MTTDCLMGARFCALCSWALICCQIPNKVQLPVADRNATDYYAPPLIGGGIKWQCCLTSVCLMSVCLSHTLGLSREQRGPGRPKLAQCSPRHTWLTPLSRSKVKVTRPLGLAVLSGQHGHRVSNGSRCMYDVYHVTTCRPGWGILWRPPTYSLLPLICKNTFLSKGPINKADK